MLIPIHISAFFSSNDGLPSVRSVPSAVKFRFRIYPPSPWFLIKFAEGRRSSNAYGRGNRGSAEFQMNHEATSRGIIGAAMAVLNELRPGLDEKVYENALVVELRMRGHQVEQQREHPVHYRGHLVGTLIPDLIVDDAMIADPKVVSAFNEAHYAQMLGYLNITGLEVALLLNFKESHLNWKRIVRTPRIKGTGNLTADGG